MSGRSPEFRKFFTVEEANAALPLVRAITADLVSLSKDLLDRRERLLQIRGHRDADRHDPYSQEVAQIEAELEKDAEALSSFVEELRALGVEPKNGLEGIVDFPSRMDGRTVLLCWKLGEPEVLHWHEIEAGFAGRQPLTASAINEVSAASETTDRFDS
jgi:hypothetical protein